MPMPMPNSPPSSQGYEFKSDIGPGTIPSPSIHEDPSAEENIYADEPLLCDSKYDPSQTGTAFRWQYSIQADEVRGCMEVFGYPID